MDLSYKISRSTCMLLVFGLQLAAFFVVEIYSRNDDLNSQENGYLISSSKVTFSKDHLMTTSATNNRRHLLSHAADYDSTDGNGDKISTARSGVVESCSKDDIHISQGQMAPLPSGIPTYMVEVQNICTSCKSISNIHLSCGWFSSARLIDPNVFRRLSYNDCLVNNGNPVRPGETITFQYANTYSYPMSVSSATCN